MKLLKCYVSSFGKIKDFSYDFTDGLNEIKQNNGWGKTTFATFIKSMFYGLDNGGKFISTNPRKKYKPWNSDSLYGGYIIFETKGKQFKIERYFASKPSEDIVKLYDLQTGKVQEGQEEWGKRIFEIDEQGFLFTTYFSQDNLESIDGKNSISTKYNLLLGDTNEQSFDSVIKNLEEQAKYYSYSGNRGKIPDIKREIAILEDSITSASLSEKELTNIAQNIDTISNEIILLEKQANELNLALETANKQEAIRYKKERFNKLNEKKQNAEKELIANQRALNGKNVNLGQINGYLDCAKEVEKNAVIIDTLKEQMSTFNGLQKDNKSNKVGLKAFMICLSILLAIGGGLSFLFNTILAGVLLGLCAISLVVTFMVIKPKTIKNKNDNQHLIDKIQGYEQLSSTYLLKLNEFFNQFNFPVELIENEQKLNYLTFVLTNIEELKSQISEIEKELYDLSKERASFDSINLSLNADDIKLKLDGLSQQIKQKNNKLSFEKNNYNRNEEIAETLIDLRSEKEQKTALLGECADNYETLKHTILLLKKANENLKSNYRKPLYESLNKYYSKISRDDKGVDIDVDFNVSIEEKIGLKERDFYSRGYRDLLEVSKRFALIDVLYQQNKPFIILDDPFSNLDSSKIEGAINLLKELSKEHQIIYLVCHDSRSVKNEI